MWHQGTKRYNNRFAYSLLQQTSLWGIDDAVQRSGRLDKKVYVGPPDSEAIAEMLLHHLDGRPFTATQDVQQFATTIAGQGYSASDLRRIVLFGKPDQWA